MVARASTVSEARERREFFVTKLSGPSKNVQLPTSRHCGKWCQLPTVTLLSSSQVMLPLMLCQVNTGDGSYTIIQQQQQQQQQQQPQPQPQQQGEQPDLPVSCVIKFNQLYCGEPGASYPTAGINKYVDDNKVRESLSLRRTDQRWHCRRCSGECSESSRSEGPSLRPASPSSPASLRPASWRLPSGSSRPRPTPPRPPPSSG